MNNVSDLDKAGGGRQRGFTTLELVVVLLCVGILAALLVIYRN